MPENTGETTEPQQPATGDNQTSADEFKSEESKRTVLADLAGERDRRQAAEKALRESQDQIKAFEAEKLSDLEKAQAAAKEHQEAAAKATTEALRWRTAAKHGISDEDAETFLTATDEEALTRQAERLKALATKPGTPLPDPSQGARGEQPKPNTAQRFAEAFQGRF